MELDRPRFVERSEVFAHRPGRAAGVRFAGLWVAGSLSGLALPAVAVVGTRSPSEAGRRRAFELGRSLAACGACVISGLALGVDGAAQAGALAGGGPTVGVLGGGHAHFFPRANRALGAAIVAAGGAVLSPYPPAEPARPWQFLQRNGVVAALADLVVVVEAAERSGALNTAGWAANMSVDVCAFPGDVDRPKAAGCNALIRDGAVLVRHADDVLAILGIAGGPPRGQGGGALAESRRLEPLEVRLLAALEGEPRGLDGLVETVAAASGEILAALTRLEIDGIVIRGDGLTFGLARPAR